MQCPQCQSEFFPIAGRANRAMAIGAPLYCGRACAGLARRTPKLPEAEQKAAKSEYDKKRLAAKREEINAKKRDHYYANRGKILEKQTVYRAKHMDRHVEYCRSPEYKAWKREYDKARRFEAFGPFAGAAMVLDELEKEISTRATRYEIYIANGRFTRSAQQRRRELWQQIKSKSN